MKSLKILFIIIFATIVLLPLVFLNTKNDVASTLDNRMLKNLPSNIQDFRMNGEEALKDRIGFRNKSLLIYQNTNFNLFNYLDNPLYMKGKGGHIFFGYDGYIKSFQGLDYNETTIEKKVDFLNDLNNIVENSGAKFIYICIPDKKTVYSEFLPDSIKRPDKPTQFQSLKNALANTDIDNIFMDEILISEKTKKATHNLLYDAGHYNDYGAFLTHQEVATHIKKYIVDYPLVVNNDYTDEYRDINMLESVGINKIDKIPYIVNKNHDFDVKTEGIYSYTTNDNAKYNKTVLIYGDSYFHGVPFSRNKNGVNNTGAYSYYTNNFKNVYFIPWVNDNAIKTHLSEIKPDIVLYENCERVLSLPTNLTWEN